ncbi:hypothetical protein [Bacteroides luti]|uniref:hypothetical protein n=1 Tax=Bacteroides luti TaxID=1297750 RepID=UPI0009341B5B|nr:hypothetical protein [Bacteroides luti]
MLDQKETKNQGCIFFAKIVRLVAEGAETRFAQTAAPSFRYNPPNFFTQKKRGQSFWSLGFAIARVGCGLMSFASLACHFVTVFCLAEPLLVGCGSMSFASLAVTL